MRILKILESKENPNCRKILRQLVKERDNSSGWKRDNVLTDVYDIINAEDPIRELLRYCVYQLNVDTYRECVKEITNDRIAYNALLTYFERFDGSIFMKIEIYDYDDDDNPLGHVKDNVRPWYSNYIRVSDLPDNPITDLFLDVLKAKGWWTPDSYYYFSDRFNERLVSNLKLSD